MLRIPVGFQARVMFIGLAGVALACMTPPGTKGVLPFLASPAGLTGEASSSSLAAATR
ncbi:hypothetical protein [Sorangium cellulosum]|uniref:hypothetical protein n=1 Tax=Sorangium cellulosum TaxID=56 RepID=UPI0012DB60C8|nr:hypothetical protein [Sorangium cellulosum]